jgi:methionyl aminopeptidase
VRKYGFSVADDLIGHGIGRNLHEDPPVLNFGREGQGEPIEEGMVIAIEPMVVVGSPAVKTLKLDESFATRDGSLAAHFEHTVAITSAGPRILTEIS